MIVESQNSSGTGLLQSSLSCVHACVCYNREDLWKANNYTSCNVASDSEEEDSQEEHGEEEEEENGRQRAIQYVSGDVTHPSDAGTLNNIIVHCAGESYSSGRD